MTDQEIQALYFAAESAVSDKTASNREYVIALTRKILELAAAPVASEQAQECQHALVVPEGTSTPYCIYCGPFKKPA